MCAELCPSCPYYENYLERKCYYYDKIVCKQIYGRDCVEKCEVLKQNSGNANCDFNDVGKFCQPYQSFVDDVKTLCYNTPGCGMFYVRHFSSRVVRNGIEEAYLCEASGVVHKEEHHTAYVMGRKIKKS